MERRPALVVSCRMRRRRMQADARDGADGEEADAMASPSGQSGVNPKIFGAYDVRGVYPTDLNDETAYRIGRAFAHYLGVERIAVGRDMRLSSPALAAAFMRGITEQGTDAVDLGMTT